MYQLNEKFEVSTLTGDTWQEYLENCVNGYNGETSFWHYAPSGRVADGPPGEPLPGYEWDYSTQYWTLRRKSDAD